MQTVEQILMHMYKDTVLPIGVFYIATYLSKHLSY